MALQGLYTFNENDPTKVFDYSTNGRNATSITGFSVVSSDIGFAGVFNGASTDLNFGNIFDFGGTSSMSIAIRFQATVGNETEQIICFKSAHFTLAISTTDKIVFTVKAGGSEASVGSEASIPNDTLTSVGAVYNGTDLKIYINGVLAATSNKTGTLDASSSDFHIGTDLVDSLDGEIEMFSVYSQELSSANMLAIHDQPGGFKIKFPDSAALANGDMLSLTSKGSTSGANCVVTGDLGSDEMLLIPISNDIPVASDIVKRVGNVFEADRQWIAETIIESDDVIFQIKDRVDNFTKSAPGTEGTKGYRYTKDALKWKTAICIDFVIEPAAQVGSIDDFAPTDIEFANTLYISSTTPVSWTGLLAPNPIKPQLIFIVNQGTKNITIRNNDVSSLAANRFSLNTNVILSPNDCGYLIYDEARLRWRVNKI